MLAANAGRLVTREEILDTLWGMDYVAESNVVDRHIKNLRARLHDNWRQPRFIVTVPGRGSRFLPTFTAERDDVAASRNRATTILLTNIAQRVRPHQPAEDVRAIPAPPVPLDQRRPNTSPKRPRGLDDHQLNEGTEPPRTGRAHHGKLAEQLQTLELLGRDLKNRPDQDIHERVRVDMVSVAIEHVQQAMNALEMASRD